MAFSHGHRLRRALHRQQQRQQAVLVRRARVLAQRLPQRQMLRLGLRRQPRRIGREKCERGIGILAVLGKVEMHAAHQVPGRIAPLQELLHAAFGFGQLDCKGRVQFLPQSLKHCGRQILGAGHRRRCQRNALQFFGGGGRNAHTPGVLLLGAERGHVARAEFAPIGVHRRQRGPRFVRAQQQKPVARSAFESGPQTVLQPAIKRRCVGVVNQDEPAVRSEREVQTLGTRRKRRKRLPQLRQRKARSENVRRMPSSMSLVWDSRVLCQPHRGQVGRSGSEPLLPSTSSSSSWSSRSS